MRCQQYEGPKARAPQLAGLGSVVSSGVRDEAPAANALGRFKYKLVDFLEGLKSIFTNLITQTEQTQTSLKSDFKFKNST